MANLIKIVVVVLLLVLPALIIAETEAVSSKCKIAVSAKLDSSSNNRKQNTYDATVLNVGSAAAANILLIPNTDLKSVTGLKESGRGYALPASQVSAGGIAPTKTYSFKYTVAKGHNVKWTVSCTDGASAPTAQPTTKPTNAPTTTQAPTAAPTTKAPTTKAPTSAPTTKAPTTKAPTAAPTTKAPTAAPTTKAPTAAPTTKAPTSAPTTTNAPTTKAPTSAPTNGRICPSGTWWAPAPQTTWQWQLTGTIDTSVNVQMFDIDLFDNSAATISSLHSKGKVVICYFSTQYENWRPDASSFTSAVLGNNLDDWAGEKYVDIRSSVVRNIMAARMDIAVSKGCDGIEPDNVDGYQASTGFPLKAADQISFNQFIAEQAHARGLSVGLKNDLDQSKTLEPSFDWALNEQCKEYDECDSLSNFISAGKAVFNCEYSGSASSICPYMVGIKFSSLIKTLDLTASIKAQCCTYQSGGCGTPAHQCVSAPLKRSLIAEDNETVEMVTEEFTTQEVPVIATASSASTTYGALSLVVAGAVAVAILV